MVLLILCHTAYVCTRVVPLSVCVYCWLVKGVPVMCDTSKYVVESGQGYAGIQSSWRPHMGSTVPLLRFSALARMRTFQP
jgi:hypothetical protein